VPRPQTVNKAENNQLWNYSQKAELRTNQEAFTISVSWET
jgi:hypothetical protein